MARLIFSCRNLRPKMSRFRVIIVFMTTMDTMGRIRVTMVSRMLMYLITCNIQYTG
jgi:hypothetical protein